MRGGDGDTEEGTQREKKLRKNLTRRQPSSFKLHEGKQPKREYTLESETQPNI